MSSKKNPPGIFLKKIEQARTEAGFSKSEAAKLLGFNNYQTLSSIEKGDRNINAHELSTMASLYGRDLDYFFESNTSPDPTPLWRKTTGSDYKFVQRTFLSFLENYSNLEHLLGLKRRWKDIQRAYDKSDFSTGGFNIANRLGEEVRGALSLGSRPASNLLNVLENELRIKILHLPLGDGISGATVVEDTLGAGILINIEDAPWRRNFDLAHELFHVITWSIFSSEEVGDGRKKTRPEQYADSFASSLLLPKKHLLASLDEITIGGQIKIVDIIELAKEYGVSTDAILWRLVNLNKIKKEEVVNSLEDTELRKMDRKMRRGLFFEGKPSQFPERYIFIACKALTEGIISRGTFAKYLDIDRADTDRYLKKQGFLEKNYEKIASA